MIHHGDTETRSKLLLEPLTEKVIGAAIEVHRTLGPGLLQSAHEECLCHEPNFRNLSFQRQVPLPVRYKNVSLDCGHRIDLIVDESIVLELKCLEHILPVHEAQLLTYLKLGKQKSGTHSEFPCRAIGQGRHYKKSALIFSVSP